MPEHPVPEVRVQAPRGVGFLAGVWVYCSSGAVSAGEGNLTSFIMVFAPVHSSFRCEQLVATKTCPNAKALNPKPLLYLNPASGFGFLGRSEEQRSEEHWAHKI